MHIIGSTCCSLDGNKGNAHDAVSGGAASRVAPSDLPLRPTLDAQNARVEVPAMHCSLSTGAISLGQSGRSVEIEGR